MNPKVSIIVPVYKVEQYLDTCVHSLLNQTLKDIEIILVDDGSPDKCPTICDLYAQKDTRVKVIHKTNEGLGMARNSGIEFATGEYITFCDSDDYVDLETYETVYQICKKKNLDMCCFQHRRITIDGIKLESKNKVHEEYFRGCEEVHRFLMGVIGKDYENPKSYNYEMSSCMALFRQSLFMESGIRYPSERIVASEDFVFLLYFLPYVQSVGIIPNVFYNYLINPVSISQNYSEQKHERLLKMLTLLREYCEINFEYADYKNHYFSQMLRVFKIILKYISYSKEPFLQKVRHLSKETRNPILSEFYRDPVSRKYGLGNSLYIFCMKHHISLFFILLYKFK